MQGTGIQEQWLTVNGIRIRCFTAGDSGSPVVLLHGAGIDSAMLSWELSIEPLAEHHRVFAPDLPGYGQSDKPDVKYTLDFYIGFLAQLLDQLELPRVALVGLSMGGGIAIGFTLRYPERVTKLVPVDPYGIMPKLAWHILSYLYVITPLNELSYWFFKRSRSMVRASLLAGLISSKERLTEDLVDKVFQAAQDPSAGKAFASFQRDEVRWNSLRTNYIDSLHEITVPTLFVHGEKDPSVPLVYAQRAHQLVKHSQLHVMSECLHWPMREKPEEFNQVVSAFLRDP